LKLARQRAEVFGVSDKITFYQANAEMLSDIVPIKPYALIYSFGVIHHTPHPEKIIEQVTKYMDKNTMLKIMVYNRNSWKVLWILITYGKGKFWKLDELIAKNSEAQTGCPVTYSYTKNTVKGLLKGMKIKKVFCEHIFPYSIPEYKQYHYKKMWYFRYMPKFLFRFLERTIGWHLCVEAQLNVK
jgi:hypothetical protein